ncbi:ribosomal RNA-processing protein 8-like [Aphidius gifuensis]|uniref:ribosomal RNA-processing protein 8-like n=1 Tax=Aphidius gifuensis TaxID=684658 RepID=UPI001CDD7A4C|nr:ribosomal RNA-processing protein 8-like [Aphidius gifuensis]
MAYTITAEIMDEKIKKKKIRSSEDGSPKPTSRFGVFAHKDKLNNLNPKEYVIADFGCGDAKLCEPVEQKVHSLDLVAVNDKVTACDMAHTSLLTISVNVVVFCLSFIGKNLADYLLEANRVLKQDGILKIADVVSRFENIKGFVKSLDKYGFQNTYQDLSNNLFYFMDFKEIEDVNRRNKNLPQIYLKTCLYKRR